MSHEVMLENIKTRLDKVDHAVLQSIMALINQSETKPAILPQAAVGSTFKPVDIPDAVNRKTNFVGENLTLEEYEHLSPGERGGLQQRLRERNHLWLQEKFASLKAAWLVVVNGEIIASGQNLRNLPLAKQNVEVYQRTGKFPFVFINDDLMAIEEGTSTWHATVDPGDFYPTLPVTLTSPADTVAITGDFYTGASGSFVDYDFLRAQNLIRPEIGDYFELSRHLNQPYHCVAKPLFFKLCSKTRKVYAFETMIYCVTDWPLSPFVKINPTRVALIGRDLLLALKPRVLLDFAQRQTEILSSAPIRKKAGVQKKQVSRSRRRRL